MNFDTKTFVHTLPGNAKPAGFATLNPADQAKIPSQSLVTVSIGQAGRRVIGVTNLGEVILWDVSATPRQISLLRQEGVSCARISPDGSLAVVYHRDGTLQVWEIEGAKKRGDLTGHQGAVVDCTFSPDSKHALTVSDDRTLRQWDLATCKELCPRTGHTHRVEDVTFSDDGQRLLSGGADKTMRLWDLKKGKEKAVEIRSFVHKAGVSSVGFLPREEEVFSTEASQTARRWEVADGRIVFSFPWAPSSSPVVMLYSRKHPHAYIAQSQGSVCCVDLLSGKQVSPGATPTPTSASCLAVSADGRRVLFAGTDPLVRYADLVEGRELKRFGGHTDTVHAVAFAEEERYVLSAGKDRRLRRWESRGNGKVDREVELQGPLPKIITSMAFSPDGKLLACAGFNDYEGVVTLWDIDGKLRNHWQLPGPVQRLTFADDSIHFATANANGTVYIYRIDRVGKG